MNNHLSHISHSLESNVTKALKYALKTSISVFDSDLMDTQMKKYLMWQIILIVNNFCGKIFS